MDIQGVGRLLLVIGIAVALVGLLLMLLSRLPFLSQLGSLPGDIRIQTGGFSCFIPLASMLLISILLTIALNIIARIINR